MNSAFVYFSKKILLGSLQNVSYWGALFCFEIVLCLDS